MDGTNQNDGGWQYNPNGSAPSTDLRDAPAVTPRSVASPPTGSSGGITWTASEFIAHHKNANWYGMLGFAAVVAAILVWLIFREIVTAVFIIIAAVMFGVYARRQPRELSYRLDQHGLTIAGKQYPYAMFQSFGLLDQGAVTSIVFTPLKRFGALITVYYHPDDEEKIVALLADRLPMEARKQDAIDRLMWRIRF